MKFGSLLIIDFHLAGYLFPSGGIFIGCADSPVHQLKVCLVIC